MVFDGWYIVVAWARAIKPNATVYLPQREKIATAAATVKKQAATANGTRPFGSEVIIVKRE